MPHVILDGPISLPEFHRAFAPFEARWQGAVLKAGDCYVNARGTTALIDVIVVDVGPPRAFFIHIFQDTPGRTAVRVHGRSQVERTPAVKRMICEVAARVKAISPEIQYGHTNLPEFLVQ